MRADYKISSQMTVTVHNSKVFVSDGKVTLALGDFDEFFSDLTDIYNGEFKEKEEEELSDFDRYEMEMEERGDAKRKYGE